MVQNAIIIRRTTANASDLKSGALALNNGQWGFATTDKVLVVRDLLGNFYDIPCTDLLPDLLRVKQPVNDVLSFPPGADGDLCLVKSESAYFYSYGNSWRKLADSNQIASLVSEQIALAISAHIAESDPHAQYILGTEIGNTIAPIESGKIPTQYLPSYVDDVLEFASISLFPVVGERDKIYIAIDTNKIYRWGGSSYVEIASGGVALGETSITAYRGDRGKIAFDHSQSTGNPHSTTIADISGLRSELDGKLSSASNPDLVAIEAINGTSGLLIKTAANTWALDTNSYATTTQLTDGSVTKVGTASIGSTTVPVYVNAGVLTACSGTLGVNITGNSATATTATKIGTASIGSTTVPVYSNAGTLTACSGTLAVSITGNSATTTKLATSRTIALTGDVTGSTSFDGSANSSIAVTSAHLEANTGTYAPWQTKGSKGGYTGISMPGALRMNVMSHNTEQYAGMYCESDNKWMMLRRPNGNLITDYSPSTTSNTTEIATTAFVNSRINAQPQEYTHSIYNSGPSRVYANDAFVIACNLVSTEAHHAEAVLSFSVCGNTTAANNYAGRVYMACKAQGDGSTATPTYNVQILEGTSNIDYLLKWRSDQDASRIYCTIMFSIPAYARLNIKLDSLNGGGTWTSAVGSIIESAWITYGTMLKYSVPTAVNADTLDGYHLTVQPLSSARTAPNTVFYCY